MFAPKTIIHPTDFSDCSNYALQVASDLAGKYKSRLVILHAVETLGPANATFGEIQTELEPEGYWDRLWADLHRVKPGADFGGSVDYLLIEGDPASAIERAALEQHGDLIVMGTHGHRGLQRLLMGSVAERVVRRASCAVLTVKQPLNSAT